MFRMDRQFETIHIRRVNIETIFKMGKRVLSLDSKLLTKAVIETIWLWQNEPRLSEVDQQGKLNGNPFEMDLDWFRNFRGEWELSRALKENAPNTKAALTNVQWTYLIQKCEMAHLRQRIPISS